ncbi:MAG: carboxypeptidase-like regulatory domain-containing protein [Thermoplasmatota archaeon]
MNKLKPRKMNETGALEGLPLYLIILVVVAGVGTAIIVGWMMSADSTELGSIEVEPVTMDTDDKKITVTAYDQKDNPLEGATVTIEGCGLVESGVTDSDGIYSVSDGSPSLPQNENFGSIDVTVKYTGDVTMTKTAVITVEA